MNLVNHFFFRDWLFRLLKMIPYFFITFLGPLFLLYTYQSPFVPLHSGKAFYRIFLRHTPFLSFSVEGPKLRASTVDSKSYQKGLIYIKCTCIRYCVHRFHKHILNSWIACVGKPFLLQSLRLYSFF